MKRNLLAIGALVLSLGQVSAQQLTNVSNKAKFYVAKGALVSNHGGVEVKQGGLYENSGDVKVVGNTRSEFKTAGNNHFVLKLNNTTDFSNYGQLHIDGIAQNKITGKVDKEYRDASHGAYQQMALPFYDKVLGDLNTEISGIALTDTRWINNKATGTNVLYYDNEKVVSRLKTIAQKTTKATEYYIIGAKNLDATYFPSTTTIFKGVPYANSISERLSGAGTGVDFGAGTGANKNEFGQRYKAYVTDAWDLPSGAWTGQFGKDMYQYGNPYLTNLDLSLLDAGTKAKIKGIRYSIDNTSTNLSNVANSRAHYINFTANQTTPVGDVDGAIIKPMQVFVVKLKEGETATLNFDALRTFDYTAKNRTTTFAGLSGQSRRAGRVVKQTESVKQLDVIALDKNHNEIDRTYYVVYPAATTGASENYTVQSVASNANVIGTFEENVNGGIDKDVQEKYWLYINEANEVDFKGKKISMGLYSNDIAYLKFVVRENSKKLPENQILTSGESFYVSAGKNKAKKVASGEIIPVSAKSYGLYYGNPENTTLNTDNPAVAKPSSTILVLDSNDNLHKLIFDNTWKTADVRVFDMNGRLISTERGINAQSPYTLNIPQEVKSTFVVEAVSENGQRFSQKVKTN